MNLDIYNVHFELLYVQCDKYSLDLLTRNKISKNFSILLDILALSRR